MTTNVEEKVLAILKANPDKRPSEILEMYRKKHRKDSQLSPQKVVALRKKIGAPEVASKKLKSSKRSQSREVLELKETRKVRTFVTSRGVRFEVPEGEPLRHFRIAGSNLAFLWDDFVTLVTRNCSKVKEIVDGEPLEEIPIEDVNADDLFLTPS